MERINIIDESQLVFESNGIIGFRVNEKLFRYKFTYSKVVKSEINYIEISKVIGDGRSFLLQISGNESLGVLRQQLESIIS